MLRKTGGIQFLASSMSFTHMMVEAQTVIGLRMLGMAGLWPMGAGEHLRMVAEKASAAQDSSAAVARALFFGGTPGDIALAAVQPVRRRTRANLRRLTRKGMGGPRA